MRINALAEKIDLTAPTIRFYEEEGLLDARHVRRGANNYRDYYEEAVEHLRMIKKMQAAGFTLVELRKLIEADEESEYPLPKKVELLRQKMKGIDRKKAELEQVQTLLGKMLANKMALMDAGEK